MLVVMEMPEIAGWKYTGEYRCPLAGEVFLLNSDTAVSRMDITHFAYPILTKEVNDVGGIQDNELQ